MMVWNAAEFMSLLTDLRIVIDVCVWNKNCKMGITSRDGEFCKYNGTVIVDMEMVLNCEQQLRGMVEFLWWYVCVV